MSLKRSGNSHKDWTLVSKFSCSTYTHKMPFLSRIALPGHPATGISDLRGGQVEARLARGRHSPALAPT